MRKFSSKYGQTAEEALQWLLENSTTSVDELESAEYSEDVVLEWIIEEDSSVWEDSNVKVLQWLTQREEKPRSYRREIAPFDDEAVLDEAIAILRRHVEQQAPQQPPTINPALPYGGYDLRRNDSDNVHRYSGVIRSATNGDTLPATGTTPYVQQLQQDLLALGFRIAGSASGVFGRTTEWAVREFQIYSKMAFVAQEAAPSASSSTRYVDRLSQAANSQLYRGPVSGVVNADTRATIQHWLASRCRCPLIIEAWNMAGGNRNSLYSGNIWVHNEVATTAPRMFARDFSNYYTLPAGRNANDLISLGDFAINKSWNGPRSVPPHHTWPEAELLPEHLIGSSLVSLSSTQRSTYKVVRAVSEVECFGFFDSVNAYDNAFVSLGPCHWTLGIVDTPMSEGELGGYLAYLRYADPAAFRQAFEFFGVRIDENWVDAGIASGRTLFNSSQRKYTGWVALQQENGSFVRLPLTEVDGNYFKTWHWFYRFVMAGRTIAGFRRRMWHMARMRLRDLRAVAWGAGVPTMPDGQGGTRPATIGDVYTSERAMALILRWHIRYPGHIISGGQAGAHLRNAFTRAGISATAGDPTAWNDANEARLIEGIMGEVAAINNRNLSDTMTHVHDWPNWAGGAGSNPRRYTLDPTIGNLAVIRKSFQFDDSDLPPAP